MDKVSVLSGSPLFEMLSNQELEYVAELARPRRLSAGEVEVLGRDAQGALREITTLETPQFFGEMSLIDKEYRSATVRAKTDCELLHLSAENLTAFRKQHRDGFTFVIINIARMLSARLREANSRIAGR